MAGARELGGSHTHDRSEHIDCSEYRCTNGDVGEAESDRGRSQGRLEDVEWEDMS